MRTVIILSGQTSGTGSLWRIARALNEDRRIAIRYYDRLAKEKNVRNIGIDVPPRSDRMLLFNFPPAFNMKIDLENYKFIVNFRDPRDRLCNSYYWQFGHPTTETEERKAERRKRVAMIGIDKWVLAQAQRPSHKDYHKKTFQILQSACAESVVVIGYARLCHDFDSVIRRMSRFLGEATTQESRAKLAREAPEGLSNNADWIGNRWGKEHSDILPGRYKRELRDETIKKLGELFRTELQSMAYHDPEYADSYLENVP